VQLQQVLLIFITNAIDAMSAVGPRELTISTARNEPGAVLVTVRDSGPGIAPEKIERLFEPFYTTKQAASVAGHMVLDAMRSLWRERPGLRRRTGRRQPMPFLLAHQDY
jgi:phosphoglycerate-specific signal transduction histidine kinase